MARLAAGPVSCCVTMIEWPRVLNEYFLQTSLVLRIRMARPSPKIDNKFTHTCWPNWTKRLPLNFILTSLTLMRFKAEEQFEFLPWWQHWLPHLLPCSAPFCQNWPRFHNYALWLEWCSHLFPKGRETSNEKHVPSTENQPHLSIFSMTTDPLCISALWIYCSIVNIKHLSCMVITQVAHNETV